MGTFGFSGKLAPPHLHGIQEIHLAEQAKCALELFSKILLASTGSQATCHSTKRSALLQFLTKARQDTAKDLNTPIIMGRRQELYIEGSVKDIQYM